MTLQAPYLPVGHEKPLFDFFKQEFREIGASMGCEFKEIYIQNPVDPEWPEVFSECSDCGITCWISVCFEDWLECPESPVYSTSFG